MNLADPVDAALSAAGEADRARFLEPFAAWPCSDRARRAPANLYSRG